MGGAAGVTPAACPLDEGRRGGDATVPTPPSLPEGSEDAMKGSRGGSVAQCFPGFRIWMVALGLLSLSHAPPAHAQRLQGELLDLVSQEPLEAGLVVLRGADGSVLGTAHTNERGRWLFEVPRPGVYYLQAQRVGYEGWLAGPVVMNAGDDVGYYFHLRPRPILLDPLEVSVEATRRHLELSGFYERQRSDFGTFLGPEDMERTTAPRITEMLLGLPGVRLVATHAGSAGGRFIQLRGSNPSGGGLCRPRVFVDGLLFARGD